MNETDFIKLTDLQFLVERSCRTSILVPCDNVAGIILPAQFIYFSKEMRGTHVLLHNLVSPITSLICTAENHSLSDIITTTSKL